MQTTDCTTAAQDLRDELRELDEELGEAEALCDSERAAMLRARMSWVRGGLACFARAATVTPSAHAG
jgi:hypothetical protein